MESSHRPVRLMDAQDGTETDWPDVISLPHSSGWDGIVVGKLIDQCKRCTSLNNMRRAAWYAQDWGQDRWAREEFYRHWEEVHRND
ncbi:hypothetical protein I5Q34_16065 [Streptomyces sp. AV19]|uniref:hypothetical protein n=1 Tax=Streptomyces sp. AV19 TaxID=2793068 RepID=UPI0018FE6178|nr:hypothetical protein [Streptomyces sp. AV19]MBH1935768.1 hypothetical protein [Streptomyces sp. AV19]MDG4535958.1 hypothetical protein [Streptomyces sp. AV19]